MQAGIQSGKAFKVITLPFSKKKLNLDLKNKKIGFDPRLFNERSIDQLSQKLKIKCIAVNNNLINLIKEAD